MDVLLVSMPFASLAAPALGISLLKAQLTGNGHRCDVAYPGFAFARLISTDAYERIATGFPTGFLPGEWVFAESLFGSQPTADQQYFREISRGMSVTDRALLEAARAVVPSFLAEVLESLPWSEYGLVGFASSCDQSIASLLIARELRLRYPSITIVFGGANWEGIMGETMLRNFSFVDVAFLGEADESLVALAGRLACGSHEYSDIPGIAYRDPGVVRSTPARPVKDLDALASPDFSDFFAELDRSGVPIDPSHIRLSVQSARGCSWAVRHPCRFCGLNGARRSYRTQSAGKILGELRALASAWPDCRIDLVDTLASPAFLNETLPALAEEPLGVPLMIEARSSLTFDQVELIARAGVRLQIGIESLSDRVLGLMGKGISVLECLRLLRWCKEWGVRPMWNIIYNIPGESCDDYDEMFRLIPALHCLEPPVVCTPMFLDRFSEYHTHAKRYGLEDVAPVEAYSCVFPFSEADLTDVAYSFRYRLDGHLSAEARRHRLRAEVRAWQEQAEETAVEWVSVGSTQTVHISRSRLPVVEVPLDELDVGILSASEGICSRIELLRLPAVRGRPEDGDPEAMIGDRIARLTALGVVVSVGGRYLNLAARPRASQPVAAA